MLILFPGDRVEFIIPYTVNNSPSKGTVLCVYEWWVWVHFDDHPMPKSVKLTHLQKATSNGQAAA